MLNNVWLGHLETSTEMGIYCIDEFLGNVEEVISVKPIRNRAFLRFVVIFQSKPQNQR
jgi:hypothetical protein